MSASSLVRASVSRDVGRMQDVLIGAAILLALVALDLLALRYGADTRHSTDLSRGPDAWW